MAKNNENYEIQVDTGAVTIPVKDTDGELLGEIKINPFDVDIVKRYEKFVEKFNGITFEEDRDLTQEEVFEISGMIKEQFDYLFNYPVSDVLFVKCNPFTVISNGDFFFENVANATAGLIEKITKQRVEKKMKKIRKITGKYEKKYHK